MFKKIAILAALWAFEAVAFDYMEEVIAEVDAEGMGFPAHSIGAESGTVINHLGKEVPVGQAIDPNYKNPYNDVVANKKRGGSNNAQEIIDSVNTNGVGHLNTGGGTRQSAIDSDNPSIPNCYPHTQVNIANGSYKTNGYSVEFFYSPYYDSAEGRVERCLNKGLCASREYRSYCVNDKEEYRTMFSVKDSENKVVFQAIDEIKANQNQPLDKNKMFIDHSIIQLERTPVGFPYLTIRGSTFGASNEYHTFYLFLTSGEFNLASKIYSPGENHKGFYVDKNGNFLINIRYKRFETGGLGSMASRVSYIVPYRLVEDKVVNNESGIGQSIKIKFIIDVSAIKDGMTIYSQFDIQKLFENARATSLEVASDLNSNDSIVHKYPLYIFGSHYFGKSFYDLFTLIRNGRVDLAMQYFNLMVPDEYEQNSALLPKELNSKQKLWIAFIDDLKEDTKHRIPGETDWKPLWPLYEQFNGGSIPRELQK